MNDDPRDKAVEDAYRDASKETPPPELDARILAAARRAVNARPQDAARPPGWLSRYRVPLSVAATALIAVSVSLMVDDESRRGPAFDAPPNAQRDDPAWGSRSVPAGAPVEQRVPPDRDAAEQARAKRNAVEAPRAAEPMRAEEPPAAATFAPQPGAAASDVERAAAERRMQMRDAERSTANTAATAARNATPDAASESMSAAPAPAPAPRAAGVSVTPAVPGAPPRSAAQIPGIDSRERADSERPSRLSRDEAAPGARRMTKEETARTPEAWLEDIRRLRADGRLTDADAALAAFQRAYPDYALPADLRRP